MWTFDLGNGPENYTITTEASAIDAALEVIMEKQDEEASDLTRVDFDVVLMDPEGLSELQRISLYYDFQSDLVGGYK